MLGCLIFKNCDGWRCSTIGWDLNLVKHFIIVRQDKPSFELSGEGLY